MPHFALFVTPAKAGVHRPDVEAMDLRLRGGDSEICSNSAKAPETPCV